MTAPAPPAPPLRVVGVGASAGGLAPLIEFFAACPAGAGVAFVVVQHLGAHHTSMLAALLQPHTRLPVREAADGLALAADHVYVIRPDTWLAVADGCLREVPVPPRPQPQLPIDHLLQSLAADQGPRAVGVVLSGMGSDGSRGLRAIAQAGGLALVQTPATAQFDAMPRSAAAVLGAAAHLLLPAAMPALIAGRPAHVEPAQDPAQAPAHEAPDDDLAAIVRRVAAVTGQDFSLYKPSTLRRRIERRAALHGLTTMAEYRRLLTDNAPEAELLFKELLIGVTSFFRDGPVWEALAPHLAVLLRQAAEREPPVLRAWVAACSTGEEAYSLAMLCHEVLETLALPRPVQLQIFATDLNADAIDAARRGRYSAEALAALSPQRWLRFFVEEGGEHRVSKALRESVLFARHDLITDAPFSRLDLVCCRNLLIYFQPALQQRVMALFHYVLRPGGVLMLGSSETLGRADGLFEPVDAKLRLHRRLDAASRTPAVAFPLQPALGASPLHREPALPEPANAPPLQQLADRLVLDEFAPPAVLVDAQGDILYVSGRTGRYLEPAAGKANWNVHVMAREGLRSTLASALRRVVQEGHAIECHGLRLTQGGEALGVDLALRPVRLPGYERLVMVVFRDVALPAAPATRGPRDEALQRALEEAQALREEMRSSQEELQSTNEELQSTNEELQSTNEELTTSKEEMQAMNEELQTVNAELLSKIEDLAQAQSDLKNLLNSTQIATLFLDGRLNVRRFTEQAKKLINLRDSDLGRPLSDLTTTLDYPALAEDVATVLRTLEYCERAVRTRDGLWYSVRIMPYRTQDNVIDGSVITFVDISAVKALEARLDMTQAAQVPKP